MMLHSIMRLSGILLLLWGCQAGANQPEPTAQNASGIAPALSEAWKNHWFDGLGELTSYQLQQARYGEIHEGNAVLVFVTEDFLPEKQVKDETGREAAVPTFKVNFTKRYYTGLYPYSMMFSAFHSLDGRGPGLMKVSSTVQDWCGHTFTQFNRRGNSYHLQRYSYFEREGDTTATLPAAVHEDDLWLLIRLNPELLPTGRFEMVRGTFFTRLRHDGPGIEPAEARLDTATWKGMRLMKYHLTMPETAREMTIYFQKEFPYLIEGWEETYNGIGFKKPDRRLTTTATRLNTLRLDYWRRQLNEDLIWRDSLGISQLPAN